MAISSEAYRDALRHFPAGVTLLTIRAGEEIHGLTVSAFASVSPEPPLIAVIIDRRHHAHTLLERDDAVFAISILAEDQRELSNRFAWTESSERFEIGRWSAGATGAPVLADALAWLDCRVWARHPAGTHTVYLGEVVASQVPRGEERPLIYWNRDYQKLE